MGGYVKLSMIIESLTAACHILGKFGEYLHGGMLLLHGRDFRWRMVYGIYKCWSGDAIDIPSS